MRTLGDELRGLRLSRGHTQGELVRRLPADITAQTLASYELGARHCTVQRLFDICEVLEVSAADVLDQVMRRLHQPVATTGLTIDLRALARSTSVRLYPLRRWAIIACEQRPDLTDTTLSSTSVEFAAELCGTTVATLTTALKAVQPTKWKE
jgi:transcriptional regulator with XRE-family HTH domain